MPVKHELETLKILLWWGKKCGATTYCSLLVRLCCSCRFSLISHPLDLKSFCFSAPLCEGWLWLLLICCSKLKDSSTKWQSHSQSWGVKQQNHAFRANWTDWVLSLHYLLWLLDNLSVHLSLDSTAPFGRASASVTFLHSLNPPHCACCTSLCSIQDITLEGFLSSCGCSLYLTLTTSIGIWHSAGVTKGVTSPAAHRGVWHGADARKSWLHSSTLTKSLALISKWLKATEILYLGDKRNARRLTAKHEFEKRILITGRYGAGTHEC